MNILEERFYEGMEKGIQQGIQQGRQEALEQGIKQGMKKEKFAIAKRLLARGENIETVAKLTDLSIEEVTALIKIKM